MRWQGGLEFQEFLGKVTLYTCVCVPFTLSLTVSGGVCVKLKQKSDTNVTLPHSHTDCQTTWGKTQRPLPNWNHLTDPPGWAVIVLFRLFKYLLLIQMNQIVLKSRADLKEVPQMWWLRSNNIFSSAHIKAESDYTTLIWDQTSAKSCFFHHYMWLLQHFIAVPVDKYQPIKHECNCSNTLCSGLVIITYRDRTCLCLCPAETLSLRTG